MWLMNLLFLLIFPRSRGDPGNQYFQSIVIIVVTCSKLFSIEENNVFSMSVNLQTKSCMHSQNVMTSFIENSHLIGTVVTSGENMWSLYIPGHKMKVISYQPSNNLFFSQNNRQLPILIQWFLPRELIFRLEIVSGAYKIIMYLSIAV